MMKSECESTFTEATDCIISFLNSVVLSTRPPSATLVRLPPKLEKILREFQQNKMQITRTGGWKHCLIETDIF